MEVEIKVIRETEALNVWTIAIASVDGKTYQIQMVKFENSSQYGIGGAGRISKLWLADADKKVMAAYDRGWDIRPKTAIAKAIVDAIIAKFN